MQRVPIRRIVYLSGGDADVIAPLVDAAFEIRPELVLDGLALALP